VQAWPPPSSPLQTPVVALQPLPQAVVIRAPFSQREAVLPWQVEPAPAHWTQLVPSAAQKPPGQAWAQQRLPPLTCATQAPDAHSLLCVQACPTRSWHVPLTSWRSAGQTHAPSAPQARPDVSQPASQQRLVPVTSSEHTPD
jgi:hypothetical protein